MKINIKKKLVGIIIPILVALFNILIILFPTDIIDAARQGISLWFNNVFPSLLPFIIGTNILTGLGFVSFMGSLLEPIMYPLFGVPGCGGFALITGMTSGYPMGAKTVTLLREKNQLNKIEAQRLIAFSNNSGPLFILGAVGVGMFKNESIGYFLMICHYFSAIITGILFKYYKYNKITKTFKYKRLLHNAYQNMKLARQKDGRSFGSILGDSVKNAMETIVVVGGFIILFCVIVKIFEITDVVYITEKIFSPLLTFLGISKEIFEGFFIGIIEITNGLKILSVSSFSKVQVVIAVGVISFGGFSIHAQTLSFINKTDINTPIYILSKTLHSGISMVIAQILFPFFNFNLSEAIHTININDTKIFDKLAYSTAFFALSIVIIIFITFVYNTISIIKIKKK